MTYPGTPSVYYGDEIALRGTKRYDRPHRDQDARWPFPWDNDKAWDHDMLRFFRQVIALRRAHPALRSGRYEPLHAEAQTYAFLRTNSSETLVVVLNSGDTAADVRIPLGPPCSDGDLLTPLWGAEAEVAVQEGNMKLCVAARSGAVFLHVPSVLPSHTR
jgi:glycosidase